MTTDVVNTIVASDEKNVNKFDKDRGFLQIVRAGSIPAIFILMRIGYEANCVTAHRVAIIPEVLEIRLRQGYEYVKLTQVAALG